MPRQQISLVDVASFDGDGVSSGILGLGLRGLTSAFREVGPRHEPVPYAPLIETLGASGAADPVVSFAMSRDEDRSYIAFGGVPPVQVGEFAVVPIQKVCLNLFFVFLPSSRQLSLRCQIYVALFLPSIDSYEDGYVPSILTRAQPLLPGNRARETTRQTTSTTTSQ